jgi:hypothetical protein
MDRDWRTREFDQRGWRRIGVFGPSFAARPSLMDALERAFGWVPENGGLGETPRVELVEFAEMPRDGCSIGPDIPPCDAFLCLCSSDVRPVDVAFARLVRREGLPCLFLVLSDGNVGMRADESARLDSLGVRTIFVRRDVEQNAFEVASAVRRPLELARRAAGERQPLPEAQDLHREALLALLAHTPAANEPSCDLSLRDRDRAENGQGGWIDPRALEGYLQEHEDAFLGRLLHDLG